MEKESGFAEHLAKAMNMLERSIKNATHEDQQKSLKVALGLLHEADNIVWRVDAEQSQERAMAEEPLADKCMICGDVLTEACRGNGISMPNATRSSRRNQPGGR
jgi:hypothetical protein